jgi:hypothetical protein
MLSQMRRQRASKSINTTNCDQTDDPAKPAYDTIFAIDTLSNAKKKNAQEAILAAEINAFWTKHQIKKVLHPMRICQTDQPEDCFIAADSAYWTDYLTEEPIDTETTLRIGNQDWQADMTAGLPMAHNDKDDESMCDCSPDDGFWMDDTHFDHDGYRVDDEHAYDATIRKEYHSLLRLYTDSYYMQDDQKHAFTLKDYTTQPESTHGQETNAQQLTAVTIPNGHFTQQHIHPRPSRRKRKFNRTRPCTLTAPSRKSPQHSKMKVSNTSNDKWRTQARQFLTNWTPRHMDAYLAIPEVALEWNVDPG